MKSTGMKALYGSIIAFILLTIVGVAYACGPFFNEYTYMPEDSDTYYPLQDANTLFTSKYGLILSNWRPEYLYPVYMDLVGKKISEETKKILLQYYDDKDFFINNHEPGRDEWHKARKTVVSEDIKVADYAEYADGYNSYVNCNESAFVTAKETLENRKKVYSQEQLVSWVKRQDEVFSHCGDPLTKKIILTEADILSVISDMILDIGTLFPKNLTTHKSVKQPTADELYEYDKEYQEAAIDFYQSIFDGAEKKFSKIADNSDQPWRGYASLVIGRIYIRLAELGTVEKYDDSEKPDDIRKAQKIRDRLYAKAERQFNKILVDRSLSEIHSGAKNLLNFVLFRINPKKRLKIAEDVLLNSNETSEIINNIDDYSLLWSSGGQSRNNEENQKDWERFILGDGGDFTQWIYIWKYGRQDSLKFALDKYNKDKSLPWLLASLKYMTPDNPSRDEIMRATESVPRDSSAYLTANYYRIKFLIASGLKDQAKKELENIFTVLSTVNNPLAENYFNELRMSLADSFNEVLTYSIRNIIKTLYVDKKLDKPVRLLDKNVMSAFNKFIPMSKWVDVVLDKTALTPQIRKQMALIAFVRAVLLEDWKTAQTMVDLVASDPILKKDFAFFRTAQSVEEKKFASAYFLLEYAGIGNTIDLRFEDTLAGGFPVKDIDVYRRNWWCGGGPDDILDLGPTLLFAIDSKFTHEDIIKRFFSNEEISQATAENIKIESIVAPNYLSSVVIDYALNHNRDQRVPQALHMAVVSTRIPLCKDKETSEYSKRAFQLLHNNYPNNYWTKETPYWY